MSAAALLAELTRARVELRAVRGRLHFVAPVGVLTPAVLGKLREHKPALLELLASSPAHTCACGGHIVHNVDGRALCVTCARLPAAFGVFARAHVPTDAALAEVARIAPDARRIGWHEADLWQTEGWFLVRGLVAFVRAGDRVELVTESAALFIGRGGRRRTWTRPRYPSGGGVPAASDAAGEVVTRDAHDGLGCRTFARRRDGGAGAGLEVGGKVRLVERRPVGRRRHAPPLPPDFETAITPASLGPWIFRYVGPRAPVLPRSGVTFARKTPAAASARGLDMDAAVITAI